jgi:hypothetical protein
MPQEHARRTQEEAADLPQPPAARAQQDERVSGYDSSTYDDIIEEIDSILDPEFIQKAASRRLPSATSLPDIDLLSPYRACPEGESEHQIAAGDDADGARLDRG